jgi:hypothetical protein
MDSVDGVGVENLDLECDRRLQGRAAPTDVRGCIVWIDAVASPPSAMARSWIALPQ